MTKKNYSARDGRFHPRTVPMDLMRALLIAGVLGGAAMPGMAQAGNRFQPPPLSYAPDMRTAHSTPSTLPRSYSFTGSVLNGASNLMRNNAVRGAVTEGSGASRFGPYVGAGALLLKPNVAHAPGTH